MTASKNLEFVPASRVAYNFQSGWALAVEEYADYGRVSDLAPAGEQAHQLYAVVDRDAGRAGTSRPASASG